MMITCEICTNERFTSQIVTPDNCSHQFCKPCLKKWKKKKRTCPYCRVKFKNCEHVFCIGCDAEFDEDHVPVKKCSSKLCSQKFCRECDENNVPGSCVICSKEKCLECDSNSVCSRCGQIICDDCWELHGEECPE